MRYLHRAQASPDCPKPAQTSSHPQFRSSPAYLRLAGFPPWLATHARTHSRRERAQRRRRQLRTKFGDRGALQTGFPVSADAGKDTAPPPAHFTSPQPPSQPAFIVAFLRREREMAAPSTSDRGCAERLRSSQHRSAAGNCDVTDAHAGPCYKIFDLIYSFKQ